MPALTTEQVLVEEAIAIHGREKVQSALGAEKIKTIESGAAVDSSLKKDLYRTLNALNSAALCLSGGGIRSATFSLGVIQALATHPRAGKNQKDGNGNPIAEGSPVGKADDSLLARFHYLSTVSGGGYIGSWLSAWLNRSNYPAVWADLVGRRAAPEDESAAIHWLRTYGNFLTPKLGVTSADSWAAIAVVLRNLILNWLVVLPVLCLVLILLKLFAGGVAWFAQFDPRTCGPWLVGLTFLGLALLGLSLQFTTRHRPTRGASRATQGAVLRRDLLVALLAGAVFTAAVALPCAETFVRNNNPTQLFVKLMGIGIVVYAAAWWLAFPRWRAPRDFFSDLLAWIVAGTVYGGVIATGLFLYIYHVLPSGIGIFQPREALLLVLGVPWALTAQLIAEMIFVGLTSWEEESDGDREWLARAAGWYLLTILGWALLMFLVFVGSQFAQNVYAQVQAWLVAGGTGTITALVGKSALSPAKGEAQGGKQLSANIILAIAAPIFAAALIIAFSALIDSIVFGKALIQSEAFRAPVDIVGIPTWPGGKALLFAFGIISVIAFFASKYVNINRFSLHALYRNRLVRAFLGASNKDRDRDRNRFTDFAESDNLPMYRLWPPSGQGWQPFHIVNMALNIVASKNLAWQERKAESFTVGPLHSGSAYTAFRVTKEYAHEDKGITLGTAMAISGAAASPNMGYHSSPSLAFLMTLFNVRLGWWLGNPGPKGEDTYRYEGPRTAIVALLSEMFGRTTDDHPYIYLSDGGHFENLGLYEMVRRRCRFIVVVDAGCDPKFEFEDLGNAVRKIWLDLGVDITFRGLGALRHRPRRNFPYQEHDPPFHAIGKINYRAADDGGENGTIVYIKPAFHKDRLQDVGVANFAVCNPAFPHEPTLGDQFFGESQFESYRALGFDIADGILQQAFTKTPLPEDPKTADIFTALDKTLRDFPASEASLKRPNPPPAPGPKESQQSPLNR